jgi:beta-phosphoglucomutase-like phosphatase (HAD superfamily)
MLVIEDTGFGVEAAYRAGCEVIMIPSVNPASEKDKKMALRIEKDMHEALSWMQENIRRKE